MYIHIGVYRHLLVTVYGYLALTNNFTYVKYKAYVILTNPFFFKEKNQVQGKDSLRYALPQKRSNF